MHVSFGITKKISCVSLNLFVMILIGIVCSIGLFAFVIGAIQQLVKKENRKTRYVLYSAAALLQLWSGCFMHPREHAFING